MPEPRLTHRVLILSPYVLGSARGNASTARRTASRLEQAGAVTRVVQAIPSEVAQAILDFQPDVLHGIHVGHTLRGLGNDPANLPPLPLVLCIGGNDLFEDLGVNPNQDATGEEEGETRADSVRLIRQAAAVVVATEAQRVTAAQLRGSGTTVFLAPRFPEVGHEPIPKLEGLIASAAGGERTSVLVWSGALRRQKRPEWILPIHRALRGIFPTLVTVVAGPSPRDESENASSKTLQGEPGIALLPPFPCGGPGHGCAGTLLALADVVLNTSRTEGMSNFILEALAEGTPVVAANTPGNRDWLTTQALLFDTKEQAVELIRGLLESPSKAKAQADLARGWLAETASPEAEAKALSEAHQAALAPSEND